jgi:hypothetical protein
VLFDQRFWPGIADGSITLAFRRWKRPTVRSGGSLLSPAGKLGIDSIEVIAEECISDDEAQMAGFDSVEELLSELRRNEGTLYRISFRLEGPDPRIALREDADLGADELEAIKDRLERMDRREAWTLRTLRLIDERPGTLATKLAVLVGSETAPFKARVRRLKEMGLTESLPIGYRLSPRGRAVLAALEPEAQPLP